jgi:hypothetical protein
MKAIDKIMVVIDANEDFSKASDGLPIELRKALRLISDKQSAEIMLVSVGYERYLSSNSYRTIVYDYDVLRKDTANALLQPWKHWLQT